MTERAGLTLHADAAGHVLGVGDRLQVRVGGAEPDPAEVVEFQGSDRPVALLVEPPVHEVLDPVDLHDPVPVMVGAAGPQLARPEMRDVLGRLNREQPGEDVLQVGHLQPWHKPQRTSLRRP